MIYADYNATYPLDPKHIDAVSKKLGKAVANPSSIHTGGRAAKMLLEEARESVASLLGCSRHSLIFTSGATESNNWVIKTMALAGDASRNFACTAIEHPSVLVTMRWAAEKGFGEFREIACQQDGVVHADAVLEKVDAKTALVAFIHANNEVGSVNPVVELAQAVRSKAPAAHIHVDGVQAFGKIDLQDLSRSEIDSYAISGHKIGGFTGIGGLYLRKSKLEAFISGGGQERGLRAGTENLPGAISLGLRCQYIRENPNWLGHLDALKERFVSAFRDSDRLRFHNPKSGGLSGTLNFHVEGLNLTQILMSFDRKDICVSSQSACSSGQMKSSHVLTAMGYNPWVGANSIRVSLGEGSRVEEVDAIISCIKQLL